MSHEQHTADGRLVDMHVHTHHSDGQPSVEQVEERCLQRGHGAVVTDHNEIRGSIDLLERGNVKTLAGIEVGTKEGLEFLVYFDDPRSMEQYYVRAVEPYLYERFMVRSKIDSVAALESAKEFGGWVSLAHPFAFGRKSLTFQTKKRGESFCDEVMQRVDALELFNGGIPKGANAKAQALHESGKLLTSGSDSHVLSTYGTSGVWFPDEARTAKAMLEHLKDPLPLSLQIGHQCSVSHTVMMIVVNHTRFFLRGRSQVRVPGEALSPS